MAHETIDLRQSTDIDMVISKSMDLDAVMTCQYYTGTTINDIVDFDFTNYTGATLVVKQNYKNDKAILTFDTSDGSIVLGTTGGTFQLKKTSAELSTLPIGEFQYTMWLRSTTQTHRAFLSGKFIIESVII
jgi:hypothetical protein